MSALKRTLTIEDQPSSKKARKSSTGRVKKMFMRIPKSVDTGLFAFRRRTMQNVPITLNAGWGGVGYDMTLQPNLSFLDVTVSGTTAYSPSLPNVTEFTNLFDQYRIKKVVYRLWASLNNSNSLTNLPNPLVHIVNDYNSNGSFALTDIEQHPDMKTYQLGTNKPITWSVTPHVRADVLTITGITSSSAWNVKHPWIDTTSTNINHLGTRLYLNNQGRNTATDIGTMTIEAIYYVEFKNVK